MQRCWMLVVCRDGRRRVAGMYFGQCVRASGVDEVKSWFVVQAQAFCGHQVLFGRRALFFDAQASPQHRLLPDDETGLSESKLLGCMCGNLERTSIACCCTSSTE